MKIAPASLVTLLSLFWGATARADLIGSTVDVTTNYPDSSQVYSNPGSRVVTSAIEYPTGSFAAYNPAWQADVAANKITLTYNDPNPGFFVGGVPFNGFVMNITSGPSLLSASVDPASHFMPVSISIEGGNRLLMNFEGQSIPAGSSAIIDFTTGPSAPEPSGFVLAGMGVAGLVGCGWRRWKLAVTV